MSDTLTDFDYDIADAVCGALTDDWQTPSQLARRAKISTAHAHRVLPWLMRHDYLIAAGNGAWRKYRARRAGERNA